MVEHKQNTYFLTGENVPMNINQCENKYMRYEIYVYVVLVL